MTDKEFLKVCKVIEKVDETTTSMELYEFLLKEFPEREKEIMSRVWEKM